MCFSEISVKRVRVNQGLGVLPEVYGYKGHMSDNFDMLMFIFSVDF